MERTPTPIIRVDRVEIASRPMTPSEAAAAIIWVAELARLAYPRREGSHGRSVREGS